MQALSSQNSRRVVHTPHDPLYLIYLRTGIREFCYV